MPSEGDEMQVLDDQLVVAAVGGDPVVVEEAACFLL